jgi:hypothetical protein
MPDGEQPQMLEINECASPRPAASINFGCRLDKGSLVNGIDLLAQSLRRDAE